MYANQVVNLDCIVGRQAANKCQKPDADITEGYIYYKADVIIDHPYGSY